MDGACFTGDELYMSFSADLGTLWQTLCKADGGMPFSSHLTVLIPKSVKQLGLVDKRLIQAASVGMGMKLFVH